MIEGRHVVEPFCELDLDDHDVVVGPTARIVSPVPGNSFSLVARSVVIRGKILSRSGDINIFGDQGVTVERGDSPRGPGEIRSDGARNPNGFTALTIDSNGPVRLAGSRILISSPAPSVEVSGSEVVVDAPIRVDANVIDFDGFGEFDIVAMQNGGSTGNVTINRPILMRGGGDAPGVLMSIQADGDVTVGAPVVAITRNQGRATLYNAADFLSEVKVRAAGAVQIKAPITTDSGLCIQGDGDVTIGAPIIARNVTDIVAFESSYGKLDIREAITLHQKPFFDFVPFVISGASIAVGADIVASGLADDDEIDISYNDAFAIAGGRILASGQTPDLSPDILLRCLCTDADGDQSCDAGCNSDPTGINSQTTEPTPRIVPSLEGLDFIDCGF